MHFVEVILLLKKVRTVLNVWEHTHVSEDATACKKPEGSAESVEVLHLESFFLLSFLALFSVSVVFFIFVVSSSVKDSHTNGANQGEKADDETDSKSGSETSLIVHLRHNNTIDD